MRKKSESFQKFISSGLFSIIILIILFFSLFVLAQNFVKRRQIQKEMSDLKSEIGKMERSKKDLTRTIERFNSESFGEKEARLKLGLQKEGERVVIISPSQNNPITGYNSSNKDEPNNSKTDEPIADRGASNPIKWRDYFWNKQ